MAIYQSEITVTRRQANDGFYKPNTGCLKPPLTLQVIAYMYDLVPGVGGYSIIIYPGNFTGGDAQVQPDGTAGNSGTLYSDPGDPTTFWKVGDPVPVILTAGLLATQHRLLATGPTVTDDTNIFVQFIASTDLGDDGTIPPEGGGLLPATSPEITQARIVETEPPTNEIIVSWTPPAIPPEYTIINVAPIGPVGVVPPGTTEYPIVIPGPFPPEIEITIIPVTPPFSAPPTTPIVVPLPISAMVLTTPIGTTGGISLGGSAGLQIIGDPSGIYTLVPGQAHDILYERLTGIASQTVKIPRPFVKTAFHGK